MIYTIVAKWQVTGTFQVEAASLKDAKEKVFEREIPEVTSEYVDDTFEVDHDATGNGHPQH